MNETVLSCFYRYNGKNNEFLKNKFIKLIRNKIIDPNTKVFLSHGFYFKDEEQDSLVKVPCDDCNWNEYLTFNEGFKLNIFSFPFSIKLYHEYFLNINDYNSFLKLFNEIIKFRTSTIKLGWAIKYGLSYNDKDYALLEDLSEKELLQWYDPRDGSKYSLEKLTEEDLGKR